MLALCHFLFLHHLLPAQPFGIISLSLSCSCSRYSGHVYSFFPYLVHTNYCANNAVVTLQVFLACPLFHSWLIAFQRTFSTWMFANLALLLSKGDSPSLDGTDSSDFTRAQREAVHKTREDMLKLRATQSQQIQPVLGLVLSYSLY